MGKTENYSLKVKNTTGMSNLTTIVQYNTRSPSLSNRTTKRNKRISNWQRRSQTLTFRRWHDNLCGKPKDSTTKLLELIQEFSEVAGYKINAQKSVGFLYTNSETEEREIKESIPFTIAPQTIGYLWISLTKDAMDLYSENYTTLMKEIEEDTKK